MHITVLYYLLQQFKECIKCLMCYYKLESGTMPKVMVALPNIVGALCSIPQSLADAHYLSAMQ